MKKQEEPRRLALELISTEFARACYSAKSAEESRPHAEKLQQFVSQIMNETGCSNRVAKRAVAAAIRNKHSKN